MLRQAQIFIINHIHLRIRQLKFGDQKFISLLICIKSHIIRKAP